jgi:Tfp pilus assembly protein PilF
MSSRLCYPSLAFYGFLLLLNSATVQAQQLGSTAAPATNAPAAKAPNVKVDAASQAIAEAAVKMDANDLDGAIAKLTDAITANPKLSGPYVFRASVYCQKKMWPEAEADFKAASAIDPTNIVIKFNLYEVKFNQKEYDKARAGYATLVGDPQMGDLASYKVFLCDLLSGHDALAKKERDSFDQINSQPSYYFSNAAWALVHKDIEGARSWLVSAANIYPSAKISYYVLPLKDLGYLPIPPGPSGI